MALYLTPDSIPTDYKCRLVRMPDDFNFFSAVNAALTQLTYPENWEQGTGISPDDAADLASLMYEQYSLSIGPCMIGQIIPFAGNTVPTGWLICDGSVKLRTDYPLLYAALASVFIVDADHLILPDLRGRTIVGSGTGTGLTTRTEGASFGEETHVLTTAELASHTHTDAGHTHTEGTATATLINGGLEAPASSAFPSVGITGSGNASIQPSGSGSAHNNVQPSVALEYIIQAS